MIVLPIKSEEAVPWIMQKHYAKRLPSISYAFGLYEDSKLVGVVTYGIPASNSLCEGICGKEYKEFVIELNRLCRFFMLKLGLFIHLLNLIYEFLAVIRIVN